VDREHHLALELAAKIKAGTVWINSTNLFDAAAGFGGYRESGFGREGGKEGLWEYVQPAWLAKAKRTKDVKDSKDLKNEERDEDEAPAGLPAIDRTAKLYIGGKQSRPDGEAVRKIRGPVGGCWARWARVTGKICATPSRRPARRSPAGRSRPRICGADPLLHRRESIGPRDRAGPAACAT